VTKRLAAMIGLLAGFGPARAHAETNIDQGRAGGGLWREWRGGGAWAEAGASKTGKV
jgi:hypothetical protein